MSRRQCNTPIKHYSTRHRIKPAILIKTIRQRDKRTYIITEITTQIRLQKHLRIHKGHKNRRRTQKSNICKQLPHLRLRKPLIKQLIIINTCQINTLHKLRKFIVNSILNHHGIQNLTKHLIIIHMNSSILSALHKRKVGLQYSRNIIRLVYINRRRRSRRPRIITNNRINVIRHIIKQRVYFKIDKRIINNIKRLWFSVNTRTGLNSIILTTRYSNKTSCLGVLNTPIRNNTRCTITANTLIKILIIAKQPFLIIKICQKASVKSLCKRSNTMISCKNISNTSRSPTRRVFQIT